jgi:hypothetical protein
MLGKCLNLRLNQKNRINIYLINKKENNFIKKFENRLLIIKQIKLIWFIHKLIVLIIISIIIFQINKNFFTKNIYLEQG